MSSNVAAVHGSARNPRSFAAAFRRPALERRGPARGLQRDDPLPLGDARFILRYSACATLRAAHVGQAAHFDRPRQPVARDRVDVPDAHDVRRLDASRTVRTRPDSIACCASTRVLKKRAPTATCRAASVAAGSSPTRGRCVGRALRMPLRCVGIVSAPRTGASSRPAHRRPDCPRLEPRARRRDRRRCDSGELELRVDARHVILKPTIAPSIFLE
jgi:hypothetical protein